MISHSNSIEFEDTWEVNRTVLAILNNLDNVNAEDRHAFVILLSAMEKTLLYMQD